MNNWFIRWYPGTNVDLLNSLTPYKQRFITMSETRTCNISHSRSWSKWKAVYLDSEFTFQVNRKQFDKHEETVTAQADSKSEANFTASLPLKLAYNHWTKGSDTNVDYDAMTVTMTVNVTEGLQGTKLQLNTVLKVDSNQVMMIKSSIIFVAPVDFSKKISWTWTLECEFSFQDTMELFKLRAVLRQVL